MSEKNRPQLGIGGLPPQRPESIHEAIVAFFRQIVREEVEPRMPRMATVVGRDGGKLRLRFDDEDEDRTEGVPRKLGNRYSAGDRVMTMPSQAGDPVVMGVVSVADDKSGAERVVDNPDLATDAVDNRAIKKNSVQNENLAGDAVDTGNIKDKSVTPGKLSKEYADKTHNHPNFDGGQIKNSSIPDAALKEDYAKKSDIDNPEVDQGDLDKLRESIEKWVQNNFVKK